MDVRVSLSYGPIDVEIEADGSEEYKQEIQDLIDIVDQIDREFGEPDISTARSDRTTDTKSTTQSDADSPLAPLAEDLEIDINILERIIHVDKDPESPPHLIIDDVDILGDTLPERQRTSALITLYAWKVCHDIEPAKGPKITEAIDMADISTTNSYNLYHDAGKSYFEKDGQGATATVELRGPGRRQAREEILNILEELEIQ